MNNISSMLKMNDEPYFSGTKQKVDTFGMYTHNQKYTHTKVDTCCRKVDTSVEKVDTWLDINGFEI